MALPSPGKSFEQFQSEDAICRHGADQQIGLAPQGTVNQNIATGAIVGTAIGAGLDAAIGAGGGLLAGTAEGTNAGRFYRWEAQRRYDIAYQQCMHPKGNQIPAMVSRAHRAQRVSPPPPPPPDLGTAPPALSPLYPPFPMQ